MDLTERIEAARIAESGPVHAKVTGTFLKKNAVSLNNRLYPAETVENVVRKAQERISKQGAIPVQQMVKHSAADADESLQVVGRVTKVWMDGEKAKYEAEIPNTTAGRETATLVQGGFLNTVSLRADPGSAVVEKGKLGEREIDIVKDFDLGGIDYTLYPGIRDDARVESIHIFESVDASKVQPTLSETLSEAAGYAHDWYATLIEASEAGLLNNVTIDRVVTQWLPLTEKAKFKEPGKYTSKDREKIPDEDFAGPNKTFPIVVQKDVQDAARLIGHAENPDAVKRKIISIAKRKGFTLPASWQTKSKTKESTVGDQDKSATMPALSEAGSHSHAHTHEMPDPYGGRGQYTHEHAHNHSSNEMEHHDSTESHRHEHTAESAVKIGLTETKPAMATDHSHSHIDRAVKAIAEARKVLAECRLSEQELKTIQGVAAKPDDKVDQLLKLLGVPDVDESRKVGVNLTEKGASISAANKAKLSQAHDHIASALGMECAPGASSNDDDGMESLKPSAIRQMIREALADSQNAQQGSRTGSAQSGAAGAQNTQETFGVLAQAITKLAESQANTQEQLRKLSETLPQAAAKAASEVAWRPERKTQIAENRDANRPGGADERTQLQEKLHDRSVPVEQRLKLAADEWTKNAPVINTLALMGAFEDATVK